MKHLERVVTVHQPAATVWDYLSDFRSTNDWDPGTVKTERTSGDGGLGTTYLNTSKFLGNTTEIVYTVTELEPGRRITLRGENKSVTTTDTITVEGQEDGGVSRTVVTYRADFEFHGIAKMTEPALGVPLKKLGDEAEAGLQKALSAL